MPCAQALRQPNEISKPDKKIDLIVQCPANVELHLPLLIVKVTHQVTEQDSPVFLSVTLSADSRARQANRTALWLQC